MANLTKEELLILDNLMYIDHPRLDGINPKTNRNFETVGEWIQYISASDQVKGDKLSLTSEGEWQQIVDAANSSDRLKAIQIAATNVDNEPGGGGGFSAVFIDSSSSEAVVSFRGTAEHEWKDDFQGGAMADTPQQKNALKWYQEVYEKEGLGKYEVTVTGHSKGGNKAKYITILDDTVDNCVSFDGQGFSDEFFDKYSDKIAARQSSIENHNVDSDYVNILLNDVGETTYYYGHQYSGKVTDALEAHCPNTFFNNNMQMIQNPEGQSPITKELDKFFNSCLRSVDGEDKKNMLNMIGSLVEAGFSGEFNLEYVRDVFLDSSNQKAAAYILAYSVKYGDDKLRQGLDQMGLGIINDLSDTYRFLEDMDPNDWIKGVVNGKIKRWLLDKLLDGLHALGINWVTADLLIIVLRMQGYVDEYMDEIVIEEGTGGDRKVGSAAGGRPADFRIKTRILEESAGMLETVSIRMTEISNEIMNIHKTLLLYDILRLGRIKRLSTEVDKERQKCDNIKTSLSSIANVYKKYEQNILDKAGI